MGLGLFLAVWWDAGCCTWAGRRAREDRGQKCLCSAGWCCGTALPPAAMWGALPCFPPGVSQQMGPVLKSKALRCVCHSECGGSGDEAQRNILWLEPNYPVSTCRAGTCSF